MATVSSWLKANMPDSYEFIRNFFKALNNKTEGHSLRKWFGIGFFWLAAEIVLRYTDVNNASTILTIVCSMITSLVITITVGNYQEKKLDKPLIPNSNDQP